MSGIVVEAPGLLTTVQDLGREGYGPQGVSPCGAADAVSLRVANLLAGNEAGEAALEMTLLGGRFAFPEGGVVAITGSDLGATLDGKPVEMWRAIEVPRGGTVALGATRSGARAYLAVAGGICVEPFFGSASTHLLSGLGGWEGRALRKGDQLRIGSRRTPFRERQIRGEALEALRPSRLLRVTEGPQAEWFTEVAARRFYESAFVVSEESNRLGMRLEGAEPVALPAREMITEGVSLGAIQITPAGQPIILFVEQQTTGGYPKIANVISADFSSLGQLRPRDQVRFERVSLEQARSLWLAQEKLLASEERLFA